MKLKTGRHTSAIKAFRQAEARTLRNKAVKTEIRALAKQMSELISAKKKSEAQKLLPKLASSWTKAGRKNIIHRAVASRKISRISKAIHKL
jgi:small subunit ribosomal protein S20